MKENIKNAFVMFVMLAILTSLFFMCKSFFNKEVILDYTLKNGTHTFGRRRRMVFV